MTIFTNSKNKKIYESKCCRKEIGVAAKFLDKKIKHNHRKNVNVASTQHNTYKQTNERCNKQV